MRWFVAIVAVMLVSQAHAQPATPVVVSPPAKKVIVQHKCAPGAHWQVRKVWRDGKQVKVGHCVLNRHH